MVNQKFSRMSMKEAFDALGLPDVDFKTKPSPGLTSLVRNNESPLDEDILSIRAFLATAQKELESTPLGGHRKALKRRLTAYKSVLSPVRRLPPEVLGEIFLFAVSDINGFTRCLEGEFRVPVAPWRVGMVCRSWRHSALTFSQLWTSIYLLYPPFVTSPRNLHSVSPLEALRMQLSRSRDALLDVDVEWAELSYTAVPQYCELLKTVLQHSQRIAKLTLAWGEGVPDLQVMDCLAPFKEQLVHLRSVELRPDPDSIDEDRYQYIPLPWARLTHLHLQMCVPSDLEVLRAASTTLVECTLNIREWDEIETLAEDIRVMEGITFPHLQRLTVRICAESVDSPEEESTPVFLRVLTAPNLQYFYLIGTSPFLAADFVKRSKCPLLGLRLHIDDNLASDSTDAIDLLRHLPELLHLEAFAVVVNEEAYDSDGGGKRETAGSGLTRLIEGLRPQNQDGSACPKLEFLRIQLAMADLSKFADEEDTEEDVSGRWTLSDARALQDMVRSRSALKHLRVRMEDDHVPEVIQTEFEKMQDAGLDVRYLQSDWVSLVA